MRRRHQQPISTQTVRRRLHALGMRSRSARKKSLLLPSHCRRRLQWAIAHRNWRLAQWKHCMFTDEVRVVLARGDGRIRVWRRRGEPRHAEILVNRVEQMGGGGEMFWGGITFDGKTQLVRVNGSMNARKYIDEILDNHVIPYRNGLPRAERAGFILVDDNAPAHRAHIVRDHLARNRITRMDPWPAKSPDMNCVEPCWSYTKLIVNRKIKPGDDKNALCRYVTQAWNRMPMRYVRNLIRSMRRRVQALIAANGGNTDY